MKAIKLTKEQYQRSLKSGLNHLWLYRRQDTTQRSHSNSIFLGRTIGDPYACLVVEYDSNVSDAEIEKIFGKGVFIDGAVSPNDKENMRWDSFYIKH
jgi:hypothetical protein